MLQQFFILTPEIILLFIALISQIYTVFIPGKLKQTTFITISTLVTLAAIMIYSTPKEDLQFGGSFFTSESLVIIKSMILLFAVMSLLIYRSQAIISGCEMKMEFFTLILLSVLGIYISISARDLMLLFCGLELQALSGYALASFNTESTKSSEAGLKYLILGGLMTCIFLFGISILYGISGSLKFETIKEVIASSNGEGYNLALFVAATFVISAILFKLSAAPLHIWTPDVYEGSPIAVVSYFAVAQKLGLFIVISNLLLMVFDQNPAIDKIIKLVAILSMVIGAFGAITQTSLKRLMAYSTVLNMGYVLIGIYTVDYYSAFVYLLIYIVSTMGFFACLVALFGNRVEDATLKDLNGVAINRKTLAVVISIFMFSMIGIPPLAGFFGKYYILIQAIKNEEIILAVVGILSSVVAAFYYLKIVKAVYFMPENEEIKPIPTNWALLTISGIAVICILFFSAGTL